MARHPKPTPEQIAGRGLRNATEVLADHGWTRGAMQRTGQTEQEFCAVGVVRFAHTGNAQVQGKDRLLNITLAGFAKWLHDHDYGDPHSRKVYGELLAEQPAIAISQMAFLGYIMEWNDRFVASKDELLSIMSKAADDLDPQKV